MNIFHRPSASDTSDAESKRAQIRNSLFLMARLRLVDTQTDYTEVRVRNLSAGGMMVELPDPTDMNTRVELEMRGLGLMRGRVAWYAEGRAGIALDKPIDPQKVRKPVGKGNHTPAHAKPIVSRVR
ncbi:hypothetical protein ASE75_06950 [Sphingomonas sp. Leaf17]|uniref:PilZ domain-containing protein n=1 Tax=Sphingomonas sp. Leaf17 TaxID=1735683 RepID=UPI0006F2EB9F|nr:PilZ domain-containing protein [Sphingomonas sp. Leaf17]KQM64825.1 hypothetical protein ASE75_06950 [Sphingomonas sp. Leaf17]